MRKGKHYSELTIDEPIEHCYEYEKLRAEGMMRTPEQRIANIEAAWFANPGGHFRRRILKQLERTGAVRWIDEDTMRFFPQADRRTMMIVELVDAVGGALDEPYDPDRTRADYESKE